MLPGLIKRIFFYCVVSIPCFLFAQVEEENNTDNKNNTTEQVIQISAGDSIQTKEEKLEDIIVYDSDDQIHERRKKMSYLLRNAQVVYQDMKINADYIEINWETGDVFAEGKRDSTDMIIEPTHFTQAGQEYEQDAFKVNFKTKIGIAYNVRMEEGEGVLFGDRVKRVNDSVMYLSGARFTTDKYVLDRKTTKADYYIRVNQGKLIDSDESKLLITGPLNMVIYDVPTPLWMPFGFIPLGSKRAAGIIIPSFGEREDVGFFLQGLGFYLPIGEYIDLTFRGDIFTRGSWATRVNSTYRKLYRYSGNFSLNYEDRVTGIKGINEGRNAYSRSEMYNVMWTHSQDPKSNPNLVFNSSVNFSSSRYFRNSINNQNILNGAAYNNTASSTISLTKTFDELPFTAALTLAHSQNFNVSGNESPPINMTLPQLTVNMRQIFPFAPKFGTKKGLIQNLAMTYQFNAQNQINTTEEEIFSSKMWREARNGIRQNIDLKTGVTLLNYFRFNASAAYNEVWTTKTIERFYDQETQQVVTEYDEGFSTFRTFNTSVSLSTDLFGTYQSKKENAAIKGIRHVLTPNISLNYSPDFSTEGWGYYSTYRGANGRKVKYSRFEENPYGSPSAFTNASIGIGLNNNLEMKVRDKTDSTGYKKIKIFEYLTINSAYNIAADSMKISPISIMGSTSLFNQKFKINFNATLDPYQVVFEENATVGQRIDELVMPRLTNFGFNFGYSFDNKSFGGRAFTASDYEKTGEIRNENFYFDEYDYAHYAIPWRMSVQVTYNYSKNTSLEATKTTSMALSGSVSPSPYWVINGNTTYDVVRKEFVGTRLSFIRDLRSFNFTFSWVPFGIYKTWDFFIGIKANILSDALKYDQRSTDRIRTSQL